MTEKTAYRIVEIKYGHPCTLFHGMPGQNGRRLRALPVNTWVKAEKKMVVDGGKQEPYLAGFNVLLNRQDCETYLERFKAPRTLRIVEVKVRGELRQKESSRAGVMLADELLLRWPQ
jgi:hypothetical protein